MTESSGYPLRGDAAQVYESQKVPAIFQPLAEATLQALALGGETRVLDVACGTGIVARLVAQRLGRTARVIGADLNAGMVATARERTAAAGLEVTYHVTDVTRMPFAEAEFELATCQQGLQFFPDKPAALAEMRRVLAPRGRVAITVWSKISPLFAAMAEGVRKHVGETAAEQVLAPFAFRDGAVIDELLVEAGFVDVVREELVVRRKIAPVPQSVPREFAGSPVAEVFTALHAATRDKLLEDIGAALKTFATDTGMDIPQHSHLFVARVA